MILKIKAISMYACDDVGERLREKLGEKMENKISVFRINLLHTAMSKPIQMRVFRQYNRKIDTQK